MSKTAIATFHTRRGAELMLLNLAADAGWTYDALNFRFGREAANGNKVAWYSVERSPRKGWWAIIREEASNHAAER